jgi:hypothetical protein
MTRTTVHEELADVLAGDRITLYTQLSEADVVARLGAAYDLDIRLRNTKLHLVVQARALGISWERIARELNMTRQSAWERWHHVDPTEQPR